MIWLLPLLPLAAATALLALRGVPRRTLLALAVGAELALLVLAIVAAIAQPTAAWPWGPMLTLDLAVAELGRAMVVLVPAIAVPVVFHAAATEHEDRGLTRLLALLVAFTGAMELLVVAADLLTLLVAWELVGACSWALIGHQWHDAERPRAARDAFLTTRAGDLGLYLAAAATMTGTGSLRFAALPALHGPALHVAAAGLLLAAAAKSAQLPFAPWLFRAMAGPTPASALLHSATMVAAGAYALARLAPGLAGAAWLAPAIVGLGLATALAGGLVALAQLDLKRALAASTSAQYGLMFVAIGAGVPAAAGLHLVTHAAFKALLFLGAGLALHAAGTLDLTRLGLGRTMPRTAALFWVGALALAAVPPLGGAYSKEQIVAAAERLGWPMAAATIVAGGLGALYAGRLAWLAFGPARADREGEGRHRAAPLALVGAGALAVLTVLLGLLWLPGRGPAAAAALGGSLARGTVWATVASLGMVATAGAILWRLSRQRRLATLGMPPAFAAWVAEWFGLAALARALVVVPVLGLARTLAAIDDRAVAAGVRRAASVGARVSRTLAWWGEGGIDGLVTGAARSAMLAAGASRLVDERGVDAAVQGAARGVGEAGARSRALQSGFTHQYYVLLAVGFAVLAAVAAVWR